MPCHPVLEKFLLPLPLTASLQGWHDFGINVCMATCTCINILYTLTSLNALHQLYRMRPKQLASKCRSQGIETHPTWECNDTPWHILIYLYTSQSVNPWWSSAYVKLLQFFTLHQLHKLHKLHKFKTCKHIQTITQMLQRYHNFKTFRKQFHIQATNLHGHLPLMGFSCSLCRQGNCCVDLARASTVFWSSLRWRKNKKQIPKQKRTAAVALICRRFLSKRARTCCQSQAAALQRRNKCWSRAVGS